MESAPDALTNDQLWDAAQAAIRSGDPDTARPLLAEIDARQDAQKARLARVDALAHAAVWYARQGLAVFPLRPTGKTPLFRTAHPDDARERAECRGACGRDGHGLHDATTDLDTIAAWWRACPRANIGLATGSHVDVLDVDGPTGYSSLATLTASGKLPDVLGQAMTPGNPEADPPRPGGTHLYLPVAGGGNAAGIAPGLDIRGIGGYVAAPPSHGPGGGQYSWVTPLRLPGGAA